MRTGEMEERSISSFSGETTSTPDFSSEIMVEQDMKVRGRSLVLLHLVCRIDLRRLS